MTVHGDACSCSSNVAGRFSSTMQAGEATRRLRPGRPRRAPNQRWRAQGRAPRMPPMRHLASLTSCWGPYGCAPSLLAYFSQACHGLGGALGCRWHVECRHVTTPLLRSSRLSDASTLPPNQLRRIIFKRECSSFKSRLWAACSRCCWAGGRCCWWAAPALLLSTTLPANTSTSTIVTRWVDSFRMSPLGHSRSGCERRAAHVLQMMHALPSTPPPR